MSHPASSPSLSQDSLDGEFDASLSSSLAGSAALEDSHEPMFNMELHDGEQSSDSSRTPSLLGRSLPADAADDSHSHSSALRAPSASPSFTSSLKENPNLPPGSFPTPRLSIPIASIPNTTTRVGASIADFELLSVIGRGAYGKVFLVRKRGTDHVYALKVVKKAEAIKRNVASNLQLERQVLESIDHPFIVKLRYAFQSPTKLYLVMEYVSGGELFLRLDQIPSHTLQVKEAVFYMGELVLAIEHLHAHDIIYRDLKPENILLAQTGHLVLTDFGFCKTGIKEYEGETGSFCGTLAYLAPEIIACKKHGKAADWWALGILLFELLTGRPPWSGENRKRVQQQILNAPLVIPKYIPSDARHLITNLLKRPVSKRLGCGEDGAMAIKRHPFFWGLDWKALEEKAVVPPYIPTVNHARDTSNFSNKFTSEHVVDSPVDPGVMAEFSPQTLNLFQGFSYTAPGMTPFNRTPATSRPGSTLLLGMRSSSTIPDHALPGPLAVHRQTSSPILTSVAHHSPASSILGHLQKQRQRSSHSQTGSPPIGPAAADPLQVPGLANHSGRHSQSGRSLFSPSSHASSSPPIRENQRFTPLLSIASASAKPTADAVPSPLPSPPIPMPIPSASALAPVPIKASPAANPVPAPSAAAVSAPKPIRSLNPNAKPFVFGSAWTAPAPASAQPTSQPASSPQSVAIGHAVSQAPAATSVPAPAAEPKKVPLAWVSASSTSSSAAPIIEQKSASPEKLQLSAPAAVSAAVHSQASGQSTSQAAAEHSPTPAPAPAPAVAATAAPAQAARAPLAPWARLAAAKLKEESKATEPTPVAAAPSKVVSVPETASPPKSAASSSAPAASMSVSSSIPIPIPKKGQNAAQPSAPANRALPTTAVWGRTTTAPAPTKPASSAAPAPAVSSAAAFARPAAAAPAQAPAVAAPAPAPSAASASSKPKAWSKLF